jgi:deazaflavin-dependent oxidoreductase (nitroreductase family)
MGAAGSGGAGTEHRRRPIEHDDTYAVLASNGGATRQLLWYRNVIARPLVRLQDGAKIQWMRADELFGEELARWWALAGAPWPHLPEYRA